MFNFIDKITIKFIVLLVNINKIMKKNIFTNDKYLFTVFYIEQIIIWVDKQLFALISEFFFQQMNIFLFQLIALIIFPHRKSFCCKVQENVGIGELVHNCNKGMYGLLVLLPIKSYTNRRNTHTKTDIRSE